MAELASPADCLKAFYRLTGTTSDDDSLTENGEAADEVAYLYLTRGIRNAQRYMVAMGMVERWLVSTALTFASAAADGTRDAPLPSGTVRLAGDTAASALHDGAGTRWGTLVSEQVIRGARGNYYALAGEDIRVANGASLPTTLYADTIARHAAIGSGVTLDFPVDALWLVVAEGANAFAAESGFPLDVAAEARIARALDAAKKEAKDIARRSRTPRRFQAPTQIGSRW